MAIRSCRDNVELGVADRQANVEGRAGAGGGVERQRAMVLVDHDGAGVAEALAGALANFLGVAFQVSSGGLRVQRFATSGRGCPLSRVGVGSRVDRGCCIDGVGQEPLAGATVRRR